MTFPSTTTDNYAVPRHANLLTAALIGGLAIALFDGANPTLFWWIAKGVSPAIIFKSVASGVLGRDAAMNGGAGVVCLGIFLHVFIACVVAAAYCAASWKLPVLIRHPVICGIAYGASVFCVMNYVLIPHSGAKAQPFILFAVVGDLFGKGVAAITAGQLWFLFDFFGHLLGIGPLAAWATRRSVRRFPL